MMRFFAAAAGKYAELLATVVARAISSFFNFNANNSMVFENKKGYKRAMFRYYCLCIPQALVSTALITLLVNLLQVENTGGATVVKLFVDAALFVISFFIQKYWVFRNKKPASDDGPETRQITDKRKGTKP